MDSNNLGRKIENNAIEICNCFLGDHRILIDTIGYQLPKSKQVPHQILLSDRLNSKTGSRPFKFKPGNKVSGRKNFANSLECFSG